MNVDGKSSQVAYTTFNNKSNNLGEAIKADGYVRGVYKSKKRQEELMKMQERLKEMRKQVRAMIWGPTPQLYDTIGCTQFCLPFCLMQFFRMLFLLTMAGIFGFYFYIYVRASFFHLHFWGLLFTLLAFFFLFIGAGKQVCYQQLVDTKKISFNTQKKKTNLWLWGVFFYTQAITFMATSAFLYFVDLSKGIEEIVPDKYEDKWNKKTHGLFDNPNQSIRMDILRNLQINNIKKYSELPEHSDKLYLTDNFREKFLVAAYIIPLAFLLFDMFINKITIRFQHLKFSIFILLSYFIMTVFAEWSSSMPVYIDNLNWFCSENHSFLYNKTINSAKEISSKVVNETCPEYVGDMKYQEGKYGSNKYNCREYSSTYFCESEGALNYYDPKFGTFGNEMRHPYSRWHNAGFMVTVTFLVMIITFILNWTIHTIKGLGATPYLGPRGVDQDGVLLANSSSVAISDSFKRGNLIGSNSQQQMAQEKMLSIQQLMRTGTSTFVEDEDDRYK